MTPPEIRHHSLSGRSAWQDRRRLLQEAAVSDIRGKPTLRHRDNRDYWYDWYRQGDRIVERYIGEDRDGLRQRLARHDTLRQATQGRGAETSRLIRLLRSEGYLTPDLATGQVLAAMARSGVFRLGGTRGRHPGLSPVRRRAGHPHRRGSGGAYR